MEYRKAHENCELFRSAGPFLVTSIRWPYLQRGRQSFRELDDWTGVLELSQRRNKEKRERERAGAAERLLSDPARIYDDLLKIIRELPLPQELPDAERNREYAKDALAPAVGWGWLMRIARSGAAAIHLEKSGFGGETAPLTRSAIEHAIRLLWAREHGNDFLEVALLEREEGLGKILKAQKLGWEFDPEVADAFEQHAAEASEDHRSFSYLTHLRAIVDLNTKERGPLYMGWLLDTQESHPSLASAQPYYDVLDENRISLRATSKFRSEAALKACFALIAGLHAYGGLTDTAAFVEPRLEAIIPRLYEDESGV